MAIVFISPKQRQKTFFMAISGGVLLFIAAVSFFVFLSKPGLEPSGELFIQPKININFSAIDVKKISYFEFPNQMKTQFDYQAQTLANKIVEGKISAFSLEDAKNILTEEMQLKVLSLREEKAGRENPFVPYYTPVKPIKK